MKTLLLAIVLCVGAPAAFAADENNLNPSSWTEKATYGGQFASKAGFGAKNLLLGWTELIQEPIEQKSVFGVAQGLGNAVMDTVGGFLHLVTSPLTDVDVPLPENGTNVI